LNTLREKALEHESHHHHHPHGTGMRWLDITLGVAATIVSLVSLWLGLHSAHSMEKLVAANSYPYLELDQSTTGNTPLPGSDRVRNIVEYALVNNGVGPARIEWVEMRFKGKPVANLNELLDACCAAANHEVRGMNRRGSVEGVLVRPGTIHTMFTWTERPEADPVFDALHRQMKNIEISACYCSVFDECYVRTWKGRKPEPVKQCTAPAKPFRPAFRDDD
jgi:hypothetical protein